MFPVRFYWEPQNNAASRALGGGCLVVDVQYPERPMEGGIFEIENFRNGQACNDYLAFEITKVLGPRWDSGKTIGFEVELDFPGVSDTEELVRVGEILLNIYGWQFG